ncbi:MAG TPA: AAA family ATPase [Actinophytocola sp.]|nr:AAA family ATPase [Actinophytocola sp.]
MSGRQDESSASGPPPHVQTDEPDSQTHDFGPMPGSSHLDEESQTDSTPHPAQQSGPHQVAPAAEQSGPYGVGGGPSGPQYVPADQSGPHLVSGGRSGPPYLPADQSGPHSGPYPVAGGPSGPHYVDQASYPAQYGQQRPAYPPPGYPPYQQPPGAPRPPADPRGRAAVHADELSSARLIKQVKRKPQSGWRKAVYVASGHLINVGESPEDLNRRELIARINQPLRGCYKIAMLSLKGGVGKTTTTTTLGSTFSSLRGDRVIAVDANPDRGTLSQKIPLETTATVRHLLRDADRIRRYSDIRAYTSQGPSRLEVLASDQDPAVSEAFSEEDYRRTITLLEHFYNIVLTDCGTGLMHSAMKGVLDVADSLVVVSSGSVDGARSASATMDWLEAHGYRNLVARSVAVINSVRPKSGSVDLDRLAAHFGSRCRAVCRIPFDPHLEEGAEIELERLSSETRFALLEMAATVADAFPAST